MNNDQIVVFIHDVASGLFLIPFSSLCIAEVLFGYVIDPMFLYCNVFGCYMHNLLRLSLKIEFLIISA